MVAAEAHGAAACATRDEARIRLERQGQLLCQHATSNVAAAAARLPHQSFARELVAKQAAVEIAKLELKVARTELESYEIRSPVRGGIRKICKHKGEAVPQFETVFEIALSGPDR